VIDVALSLRMVELDADEEDAGGGRGDTGGSGKGGGSDGHLRLLDPAVARRAPRCVGVAHVGTGTGPSP
jgi:hypothetical protein